MIHHVSLAVCEPARVARVLEELLRGRTFPFPGPLPGAYMVVSGDPYGTMIELYPENVVLRPGSGDAIVCFDSAQPPPTATATHLLLSVPLEREEVEAIGRREGWRTLFVGRSAPGRPPAFHVIEFWLENRLMLEVVPSSLIATYERYMQFASVEAYLAPSPEEP